MYIGIHVLPRNSQLFLSLVKASVSTGTTNFFFTLDAGLLAISQYSEGPATGNLDTGLS